MAIYNTLAVYKVCYELLMQLFKVCVHMPRDYKYTLGEQMKKELIELIVNVYRTNSRLDKDRVPLLKTARENLEVVRLLLRLSMDLGLLATRTFATASEKVESISKQLAAWEKKSISNSSE